MSQVVGDLNGANAQTLTQTLRHMDRTNQTNAGALLNATARAALVPNQPHLPVMQLPQLFIKPNETQGIASIGFRTWLKDLKAFQGNTDATDDMILNFLRVTGPNAILDPKQQSLIMFDKTLTEALQSLSTNYQGISYSKEPLKRTIHGDFLKVRQGQNYEEARIEAIDSRICGINHYLHWFQKDHPIDDVDEIKKIFFKTFSAKTLQSHYPMWQQYLQGREAREARALQTWITIPSRLESLRDWLITQKAQLMDILNVCHVDSKAAPDGVRLTTMTTTVGTSKSTRQQKAVVKQQLEANRQQIAEQHQHMATITEKADIQQYHPNICNKKLIKDK